MAVTDDVIRGKLNKLADFLICPKICIVTTQSVMGDKMEEKDPFQVRKGRDKASYLWHVFYTIVPY